jgi:hypothetical protein
MKALVVADGDQILGLTMFGADAGQVMAAAQTAMLAGMPIQACATRSSRTRQWLRGSAASSQMCRPNRLARDPSHPDQHSQLSTQLEAEKSDEQVYQQGRRHHGRWQRS